MAKVMCPACGEMVQPRYIGFGGVSDKVCPVCAAAAPSSVWAEVHPTYYVEQSRPDWFAIAQKNRQGGYVCRVVTQSRDDAENAVWWLNQLDSVES